MPRYSPVTSADNFINSDQSGQSGLDDRVLALALITVWATRTGRILRNVPVGELSPDELVAFWTDDQIDDAANDRDPAHRTGKPGQ